MFTGIIVEIGTIKSIEKGENSRKFCVNTSTILQDKKIGDSIAVNGVCVTITAMNGQEFNFEAIQETLDRSNLGDLREGAEVNLEPALKLNQGLDGHIVQGHIDDSAIVEKFENNRLTIATPKGIDKYLALKGSITINGVSLTISKLEATNFSVDLIPHTLQSTNLKHLKEKDKVNLEVDIIARYLESMLNHKDKEVTYEFLRERNLI